MNTPPNRSWKLGVKTRGDRTWVYNGLRFATYEEAMTWGADLYSLWTAVESYEAHQSTDEPNR